MMYDERIALIDDDKNLISYGELLKNGDELYNIIKKRCLVFVMASNTIGSVLGYTAFMRHGVVPLLLAWNLDDGLLETLINTYHPMYIWAPTDERNCFKTYSRCYLKHGYILLKTNFDEGYAMHQDLALLLTTSGSTGSPKLVRQSYNNIKSNTESIIEYLGIDSFERPITTLPMNYTYGLSIINTHLAVGATILLTDKTLMQKEFWQFFKEEKATSFGGVPYTYEMLDKLRFLRMDLPHLRMMTQAGGKLTPELHEKFAKYAEDTGKQFIVMYGQCEATARMAYLPASKAVEKKGSMGIAIPRGKFKLIDVLGNEIYSSYTTGELVYEGENVTMGYAENASDLIKGDEWHGLLKTGDMAQFDEEGYYYIVGRKKRFLKIYGNRVNLDEIERMIKGKYMIDVACAGIDDHMYIFVTKEEFAEEIKNFVIQKIRLNPKAFMTIVVKEIPKNESGKTQYQKLSVYYE